jgi:murein DD-endopeptidase MepM/ murein hydrolase activator NlpD
MNRLERALTGKYTDYHTVVDFDKKRDKLLHFDFTTANTTLTKDDIADTERFSKYVEHKLQDAESKYGIGGYNENRTLYQRSNLFDGTEPRTIHLGIDIWGAAGTKIYAPLGGMVHSFAFNNNFGDYGATIILLHQLDTISFYTLYGHVSLDDLAGMHEGKYISRGEVFAHFGKPNENGNWPPHLHFQVIEDIEFKKGDYPGVCAISQRERYLNNCPDPDLILGMMQYAKD